MHVISGNDTDISEKIIIDWLLPVAGTLNAYLSFFEISIKIQLCLYLQILFL